MVQISIGLRIRSNRQRPLQDHFDGCSYGKGNLVAPPEQDRSQAKPGAKQSAVGHADADVTDRADENAQTSCLGHGVDVGIDLVDGFQGSFIVDFAFLVRARQALQISVDGKHTVIGENQLGKSKPHLGATFDAA